MKEQEAKTKWCPFARQAGSSYNRSTDDAPLSKCIASDCMEWRVIFPYDISKAVDYNNGFCGLAGTGGAL